MVQQAAALHRLSRDTALTRTSINGSIWIVCRTRTHMPTLAEVSSKSPNVLMVEHRGWDTCKAGGHKRGGSGGKTFRKRRNKAHRTGFSGAQLRIEMQFTGVLFFAFGDTIARFYIYGNGVRTPFCEDSPIIKWYASPQPAHWNQKVSMFITIPSLNNRIQTNFNQCIVINKY